MKTKFELRASYDGKDFTPCTFEVEGEFSEKEWDMFRMILPVVLENAAKKAEMSAKSNMISDIEVTHKDEE